MKRKAGIITFHFVNNFGGVLQAYALNSFIKKNYDTEVITIDYRNLFILLCDTVRLLPITVNVVEFVAGLATIKDRIKRYAEIKAFVRMRLNLSGKYFSCSGVKRGKPGCTHYIAGSDQIWNPDITIVVDRSYYLEFAETESRKIAYAPGLGGQKHLSGFQGKRIQKLLHNFNAVSVREETFCSKIEKMTGEKVERLIDPVFLLDSFEWRKISIPPDDSDYILLYAMQNDKSMYEVAKRIKQKTGKKVIEISRYGFKRKFVDEIHIIVKPEEFIGFFQNAGCVCTNSYHGAAFSLIFEKELYLVKCRRFQERIHTLMQVFDLEYTECELLYQLRYDVQHIRHMIKEEQRKAYLYLKKNLIDN